MWRAGLNSFVATALCLSAVGHSETVSGRPGWQIDRDLKIQLVYLSSQEGSAPGAKLVPALKNIDPAFPDINNIAYKNILGLGFPLPSKDAPEGLKLYLKLFRWPSGLDQQESATRIFNQFNLEEIPGGSKLREYVRNSNNVLIKYALIDLANRAFSKETPFPTTGPGTQEELNARLPFSSIYVRPLQTVRGATERDRVRSSAQGVVSFHQALATLYGNIYRVMGSNSGSGVTYYSQTLHCVDNSEKICGVRVYELPKQPLIFQNYQDLPMPQDPKNVFSSGLLLVKLTEYAAKAPASDQVLNNLSPRGAEFNAAFQPIWSHMLEVGSVYDRRSFK